MIQEAALCRLALDLRRKRWLGRVVKAQRNDIADSLVRAPGVVMALDRCERAAQVGLTPSRIKLSSVSWSSRTWRSAYALQRGE